MLRSSSRAWAARRPPGACATGASAGSATGARRSRSSTARKLRRRRDVARPRARDSDLPVVLPEDLIPDGRGNSAERRCASLPERRLPDFCGKPARRETDTMDTFVDSARGTSCATATRTNDRVRWSAPAPRYWMPMDQYIGGIEHAILHLLYARFWTKVMRDMKMVTHRRTLHPATDAGHGAEGSLRSQHRHRGRAANTSVGK